MNSQPDARPEPLTRGENRWFLLGLFLSTLAILLLELLDARLLSVLTWYHLSFFAVSMAMFGISAGGVHVYLGGNRYEGANARQALIDYGRWFALSIPICHIATLCIPLKIDTFTATAIAGVLITTLLVSVPFYFAGVVVALSLTRIPCRIGLAYSVDLLGAALGCLLALVLLRCFDISSATFAAGVLAAGAAVCFCKLAQSPQERSLLWLTGLLLAATFLNSTSGSGFRILYAKSKTIDREDLVYEGWNSHSHVLVYQPRRGTPFYWSIGEGAEGAEAVTMNMIIDGEAQTVLTFWDGDETNLEWVKYDVTSLPYHLRREGDAGIIGVGGGRDVLTALWARSRSVTGIEINDIFLNLLQGPLREQTSLADRPGVHLVHDEARSYLTRKKESFDVLQMSLIDTWASTGAGAFTLSENGLYTVEAWNVYLDALKPEGIFSASRWFSPNNVAETTRLLALGAGVLLERGISNPADHLVLVSRNSIATLLLTKTPFTDADLDRLCETSQNYGFTIHVAPRRPTANANLARVVNSHSLAELRAAIQSDVYEFTPPTDERPYFFNMLKPGSLFGRGQADRTVITQGNMLATLTLLVLGLIAVALVVGLIFVPLWRSGRSAMVGGSFLHAVVYFACIGIAFMMIQIPYMQRFSVYLGHPIYAMAIILFSMILFTGLGSFLSDRVAMERQRGWLVFVPAAIAVLLTLVILTIQAIIERTIAWGLLPRCLVVIGMTAPLALLMGFCFPFGMRLLTQVSEGAKPWMWGINGACGVLSSIAAVAVSLWAGIHVSLYIAAILYTALLIPSLALSRAGGRLQT